MRVKRIAKACATTARPATATASQIASPIHIAARNGSTSRNPLVSTRATSAAILGPGEPAATISASAKPINAAIVMIGSPRRGSLYRRAARLSIAWCAGSAEHGIHEIGRALGIEGLAGHEPPIKDRAEERQRRELGIRPRRKVAASDALGDQGDQRLTGFFLEAVMEFPQVTLALGSVDERGDAGGEGRAHPPRGDVAQDALLAPARRAGADVGSALLMECLK